MLLAAYQRFIICWVFGIWSYLLAYFGGLARRAFEIYNILVILQFQYTRPFSDVPDV